MYGSGFESVSALPGESDDCELAKQQREAATPVHGHDSCPKQSFQTRMKVGLDAASHGCCTLVTTVH